MFGDEEGVQNITTFRQKHFNSPATVVYFNPLGFLQHEQYPHKYQLHASSSCEVESKSEDNFWEQNKWQQRDVSIGKENIAGFGKENMAGQYFQDKQTGFDLVFKHAWEGWQDIRCSKIIRPRSYQSPRYMREDEKKSSSETSMIPTKSRKLDSQTKTFRSTIQRAIGKQGPSMKETFRKNQACLTPNKDKQPKTQQSKIIPKTTSKTATAAAAAAAAAINDLSFGQKPTKTNKSSLQQFKNQQTQKQYKINKTTDKKNILQKNQNTTCPNNMAVRKLQQTSKNNKILKAKTVNITDKKNCTFKNKQTIQNTVSTKRINNKITVESILKPRKITGFLTKVDEDIENRQNINNNNNKIIENARKNIQKNIVQVKSCKQKVRGEQIDMEKFLKCRSLLMLNVMTTEKREIIRLKQKFSQLENKANLVLQEINKKINTNKNQSENR